MQTNYSAKMFSKTIVTLAFFMLIDQGLIQSMDYNGNLIRKNKIVFNNKSSNSYIQSLTQKTINFDGLIDQTFGSNTNLLGSTYLANLPLSTSAQDPYEVAPFSAMALQSDGKIVIVGALYSPSLFVAARFLPNGQLDTTFGGYNGQIPGTVTIPAIAKTQNENDYCYAIAIQPDGKIVMGGIAGLSSYLFAAVRLLPNGQLDPSFNPNGQNGATPGTMFIYNTFSDYGGIAGYDYDGCLSLAIQPNGNIIMGGFSTQYISAYTQYFSAARLLPNGTLDITFNPTGAGDTIPGTMYISQTIAGGTADVCYSLALQEDNTIIMAGSSANNGNSNTYFAAARLLSDGSLDTSFNPTALNSQAGNVYITSNIGAGQNSDVCHSIIMQPDRKIVMGGSTENTTSYNPQFAAARLLSNESLDSSFGGLISQPGTMYITPNIAGYTYDICYSLQLQLDGKILMGGQAYANSLYTSYCFAAARLLSNGQLDTATFGGQNGATPGTLWIPTILPDADGYDYSYTIALRPDGKIIMGGISPDNNNNNYFALVQLINPMSLADYQASYASIGAGLYV